jgi:DtxR family Mn-dependent transcriptional regulator
LALTIAVVLLAAAVIVFWPDRGIYPRRLRMRRIRDRVEHEDALKHAYDCESRGEVCSLAGLAGVLGAGPDRTAAVVATLEEHGLMEHIAGSLRLTATGREYALRIIRAHRLWERYLAEETGFEATEWHREAERREHLLTAADVDALAVRLGDPRWDPHGDPIPTAEGEVAPPPGFPVASLAPGIPAIIVHVEDEPPAVFDEIVAAGLFPGTQLEVIATGPEGIRLRAGVGEVALSPVVAANLAVQPIAADAATPQPDATLADVDPGQAAAVIDLAPACRGVERRRLMDLGIVPGTRITAELRAAGGDPTGYRIRGAMIALRRSQAEQVLVQRSDPE